MTATAMKSETAVDELPLFSQLNLNKDLLQAVEKQGLKRTTEIQARCFDHIVEGVDILGRAKTGTGKTVSFLLPSLQRMLATKSYSVRMLILSPTRELALQIDKEAEKLSKISHQVMYGGSSKPKDLRSIGRRIPNILTATPGRLLDHLQNSEIRNGRFSELLGKVEILVLDETDRLLDMGFRKDIEAILSYLPRQRQTLLFSATIPKELKTIMHNHMQKNFVTVDCIHDTDQATNIQVEQHYVLLDSSSALVSGVVGILQHAMDKYKKIVVFFNTAHMVSFYASLFPDALELHSRKSQSYRTRTAEEFKKASSGFLFTSDVSARGVHYPGVQFVVQVGMPETREAYIHRLGRTGRAGQEGGGLLVLADTEKGFLKNLGDLDITPQEEYQTIAHNGDALVPENKRHDNLLGAAYRSMLGFYNGKLSKLGVKGTDKLIAFCNQFAEQAGCGDELPGIEHKTTKKMGLRDTTGLNVTANKPRESNRGGGGRGGGGRGGGGGGYRASGGDGGGGGGYSGGGGGSRGRGGGARGNGGRGGRGSLPQKRHNNEQPHQRSRRPRNDDR